MTRVLVTGGNGQVATAIAHLVDDHRFDHLHITITDRRSCDITDPASIHRAIDRTNPDVIINTAAYTAVDTAQTDQRAAMVTNRDGVANLAAHTGRRLLHLSTDYVFDGTKTGPYDETDPVAPLGVYGKTKWHGEQAAATNPDHLILRTAWVYAAHGRNFVTTMLRLGTERDHLQVVADQHGSPTSAHDIADALLTLADTDTTGTFHLAGTDHTTWHDFAIAIFDHARLDTTVEPISTADYPTAAPRPANSRLDSTALETATGIRLPGWTTSLPDVISQIREATD